MNDLENLKKAIVALFSISPPKKELSAEKIRDMIAAYWCTSKEQITIPLLTAALRETSFAYPKPAVKGNQLIRWLFNVNSTKSTKSAPANSLRQYRIKSIAETQKLKR